MLADVHYITPSSCTDQFKLINMLYIEARTIMQPLKAWDKATQIAKSFHHDATAANESLCTIRYLLVALAPLEAASGQ